jgi:hypothetical protein
VVFLIIALTSARFMHRPPKVADGGTVILADFANSTGAVSLSHPHFRRSDRPDASVHGSVARRPTYA